MKTELGIDLNKKLKHKIMKNNILLFVLAFSVHTVTKAQQNDLLLTKTKSPVQLNGVLRGNTYTSNQYPAFRNTPIKDYDYYNRKSRTLRITGLSLLGAGLVLGLSGLLVASNDNYADPEGRDRTIRTLFVLSAATGIASIPLMVLAHVNKTKARASLSSQKTAFGIPGKAEKNIVGLTLSISVGK